MVPGRKNLVLDSKHKLVFLSFFSALWSRLRVSNPIFRMFRSPLTRPPVNNAKTNGENSETSGAAGAVLRCEKLSSREVPTYFLVTKIFCYHSTILLSFYYHSIFYYSTILLSIIRTFLSYSMLLNKMPGSPGTADSITFPVKVISTSSPVATLTPFWEPFWNEMISISFTSNETGALLRLLMTD